ncbi:MAG: PKD domain-containing protein [Dehalococcoidales bacterium]|nr:PKD domain-containing protein [Dehalococcoidales bacterium]
MNDFDMSDFDMSDFDMSDFDMSDFDMSDFDMSDFDMSDFDMSDFDMSDFDMSDFDMSPLSVLSFTGADGSATSGTDISVSELGLDSILDGNTKIIGFSANRGLKNEVLLSHVAHNGIRIFAVVIGSNGIFSTEPYELQIETSIPKPINISGESLVSSDQQTSDTEEISTQSGSPLTLFVTQRQRIEALYGIDEWNSMAADLQALAAHSAVRGDIISVPSDIYVGWDTQPASIVEVNNVSSAIRTIIRDYLASHTTIEYVVLVGSDEVIPHRRVPDETKFNERFYALNSYLKWGSPLLFSMLGGYNLSDDYYVDKQPTAWQGRALYIPDIPIGRLVETPQEISKAALTFLDPAVDGVLSPETALVTGYDFFNDGAELTADFLDDAVATTRAIDSNWDRGFLLSEFLGQNGSSAPDITSLNAHFTHYAALSERGFVQGIGDFLSSVDVAQAAGEPTALFHRLVFSIGCHAGLNVPANSSQDVDAGLGIDPGLDFVQAMAQQQAIYVASTGFGIGDDAGIGGTERLLTIFAENLIHSDVPAGKALLDAKRTYLSSLSAMTVFDEKSSIQTTFYGLPMYRLNVDAVSASTTTAGTGSGSFSAASTQFQSSSTVTVNEGTDYVRQEVNTVNGTYFTADGDAQATAGRAIQPRMVIPLGEGGTSPVHGVLLSGGTFITESSSPNFDPVIARPTVEWEANPNEPQIYLPSFWPAEIAKVNSLQTGDGLLQTLVVIPGQFRAENLNGGIVTGTQRLYDTLTFELLNSSSTDWQPPVISGIELQQTDVGVVVTIDASDASGIQQVVVLQIGNGTITSTSSNSLTITLTGYAEGDAIVIQVVDGAGNIAAATGKGANLSIVQVETVPEITVDENRTVTLQATLPDFANLTSPVFYVWDFGDGNVVSGKTTNGTITVQHIYPDDNPIGTPSDQYQTKVKVTDSNGGIGTAFTTVTVLDIAPDVTITSVTSPINENGITDLSGSFTDFSLLDTHTAQVDWGDGMVEALPVTQGAGSGTFTASHQYLDDNPSNTSSDNYTITVWVTDDDTVTGNATAVVSVNNLNPTVEAGVDKTANEGDTVSLDPAQFNDTGTEDTHTAVNDWGDGTTSDGNVTETNGSGTVSGSSHVYADNGVYTATVTVDDDDFGSGSDTLKVTVNNVAPTVGAIDAPTVAQVNNEMNASAAFTDPGILDTHTAVWDWGDGTSSIGDVSETNGSGTVTGSHIYTRLGTFTVTLTVTDKDGGVGQSVFQYINVHAWDPEGDSPSPDGDLISGFISNNSTTMTISLRVSGNITDQFQYRVYLDLSGGLPLLIKYHDGKLTGLSSLQAVVNGNELTFSFSLSDIGKISGDSIAVSMETQAGIKATASAGKADYMPDAGTFRYIIR